MAKLSFLTRILPLTSLRIYSQTVAKYCKKHALQNRKKNGRLAAEAYEHRHKGACNYLI